MGGSPLACRRCYSQGRPIQGRSCNRLTGSPSKTLLLPLLVLIMAAVTGLLAISAARRGAQAAPDQAIKQRQTTWLGILSICTLASVLGPIVSLAVFRNSPDVFVPVATLLILLCPLSALIYSFAAVQQPPAP